MAENFTVEKIEFKMKTQAMLNFAPMIFTFKQPRRRDKVIEQQPFWDEEVHQKLGKKFLTFVNDQGALEKIRIDNFLKEYQGILTSIESNPGLIKDTFTLLSEGLIRVAFEQVMQMSYNKFAMQKKMRSRSSL